MFRFRLAIAAMLVSTALARADAPRLMVVHEWGTFTSLQDESGAPIAGINSDDEPVPPFVHDLVPGLVGGSAKGLPEYGRSHPMIAMRLETPVLYFYPAAGAAVRPFDVEVGFRGGWLTQFYPMAAAQAPGLSRKGNQYILDGPKPGATGELAWRGLKLGGREDGPETTSKVWLAPRAVQSASVLAARGEKERYLFYRGVGSQSAPLRVSRDPAKDRLAIRAWLDPSLGLGAAGPLAIPHAWLVDIRPSLEAAYRSLPPIALGKDASKIVAEVSAAFGEDDYQEEFRPEINVQAGGGNLGYLRGEMRAALVEAGLFQDEAEAMLKTWDASYFRSPGLRLFFIVPPEWTNAVLPLKISAPARLTRAMIGRIELVTPVQRARLRGLAAMADTPALDSDRAIQAECDAQYRTLGRFARALALDEEKRRPSNGMERFLRTFGLEAYQVPGAKGVALGR